MNNISKFISNIKKQNTNVLSFDFSIKKIRLEPSSYDPFLASTQGKKCYYFY